MKGPKMVLFIFFYIFLVKCVEIYIFCDIITLNKTFKVKGMKTIMKFYIGSGFKNCELVNYYSKILEENGWKHTYNWAKNISGDETIEDLIEYSKLEQKGIIDSDVVIILLPAGRGTHIELGMALALNKKIFLCSATKDEFSVENTVNFYQLPSIVKLVGTADENLKEIIKEGK